MRVLVTFDPAALDREIAGLDEVARGSFKAQLVSEINRIGAEVHNALIEPLKTQTGLHGSTIPRAVHDLPADASGLTYTLVTRGGDISLKYFGAHEGGGGVTGYPRGAATFVAGAFMTSGREGSRHMASSLGGHVFTPDGNVKRNGRGKKQRGTWYRPISKVKSGVYIPQEMVRGATVAAFERAAASGLYPLAAKVMTIIAGRT